MTASVEPLPHVLIIGGGFGGLTAAQALANAKARITLLDRTNHHTFQPLLYQVAMAGLSPADIAQPIRAIVHGQKNVTVLMAEAKRIDLDAKIVHLDDGDEMHWDFLILACGMETSYFGHDEWRRTAPGLKSIEDAIDIRQRVLLAFELAERESDRARRDALLSFVVIGGGPTGVELAGALAELSKFALERDFRGIDPSATKVQLLEAGPRILPSFPEDLAESAVRQLRDLGVLVRKGARVTAIEPGRVHLGDEQIPCAAVIWAAGVRADSLTATLGVTLDRSGRVLVRKDLSVPGHPHAFVVGDAARLDGKDGGPLPGVSPVAMQEARTVAKSIRRLFEGKRSLEFEYFDKGSMATIGRSRAIAQINRIHLSGFVAWMAWLIVHIWYLIGFKNRLVVMIVWAWSYLTYRRGARLITGYADPSAIRALRLQSAAPSAASDGRARTPVAEEPGVRAHA
ncbi:MAG: NAD(P)/FAD-dependent oxidoreductase [Polyangiaceae bacterium]|jgi:NADH dehydrogenase